MAQEIVVHGLGALEVEEVAGVEQFLHAHPGREVVVDHGVREEPPIHAAVQRAKFESCDRFQQGIVARNKVATDIDRGP